MEDCFVKRKNLGQYLCQRLPQLMKRWIWTPDNFRVPIGSEENLAFWQAAIFSVADRIFLWPPFVLVEPLSTEAAYEITPLAHMKIHDGQYIFRCHIQQNLCIHKAMYSHRGSAGRLIPIDVVNQGIGSRDEDGLFMGAKIATLNTEKLRWGSGDAATTSPVYVVFEDPADIDKDGEIISAKFVKSLIGIVDVELKKVSAAAGSLVYDVEITCDNLPVTGLLAADFLLYEADGITVHAISGVVESLVIPGRYTISGAGFASGMLLTLRDAESLTLNGYEHPEPIALIVP